MTARTSPLPAFLVACLGIALFSVMDGVMKSLVLAIGAYNAMFWRQIVSLSLGGIGMAATRTAWPAPHVLRLHALRGCIGGLMAFTFFWGIARVPLAEGIALSFIAPLITLYLAAVMLKERISRQSILASVMGLAGVVVIAVARLGEATGGTDVLWGMASIFLSAVLYAYNLILQRQQAQLAGPVEVAFFMSVFSLATLALAAPWLAVWPAMVHLPAMTAAAILSFVSLMLLAWAYRRAEAQILVPVEYTAFLWAALVGWWAFGEPITPPTIAGTLLIVAGCLIAARQRPDHVETTAV
ncbi:MAG: DMT family transporter [Chakrabartia sp.]